MQCIDRKIFWLASKKWKKRTYDNIKKITTGWGDDGTTGCQLHYAYFKNYYNMIAVNVHKQQALDADPKAIQKINFTVNLDQEGQMVMYFIIEEAKETF